MLNFTSDQWVIVGLVFLLGLLVGGFLFSGGGRKWKQRYNSEVVRRRELEQTHADREKDWRQQDSLRAAALKERERTVAAAPVAVAPVVADRSVADRTIADRSDADRTIADRTIADRTVADDRRDTNNDGVVDTEEALRADRPAGFMDRVLGRDRHVDRDGIADRKE